MATIKVNLRARMIVKKALEDMDYEDIAELCSVSVGTVKRWQTTGRADAKKIAILERRVGYVYLGAQEVAETLVEIYKRRNRRFRMNKKVFGRIAGRINLREKFVGEVRDHLYDQSFFFLEMWDGGEEETIYIVIRMSQLAKYVKDELEDDEIESCLGAIDGVPDEDDDGSGDE